MIIPSNHKHDNFPANERRSFIKNAGRGIVAAAVLQSFGNDTYAAENETELKDDPIDETIPVKFKSTRDPSEKPEGDVPSPMRPSKRIGYAIVGLGRLSLNELLPALEKCKHSKLVALVSGDAEKAKKVALQNGIPNKNIYNYENFDNIKNNKEIDAVYIVLPNSMHEEFTVRAAVAEKHVLCEKPMATTSAAAKRMIEACKKANKKLMIAYRIQYEPNNLQIKKWTRSGEHGKVRIINTMNSQNAGDPEHWRMKKALSGGGSLPDIGIYSLNTARYLLGEEPEMVNASIISPSNDPRFKEVEDVVMYQMFFPSGAVANNTCSYSVHESRYYRCHSDSGATFGLNNAFAYSGLQIELSEVKDQLEYKSNPSIGKESDQFELVMDHFSECILKNKTPYTPGEEGLQDHMIMEAIYESARTNKPVKLKKITELDVFRGDEPSKK